MPSTPGTTTPGREPKDTQKGRVSTIRGQHKAPAHSGHSGKCGKRHERIIAYTIKNRRPVYEGATCPECGAAIRWLPLGAHGNLVPRCENERCITMPARKSEPVKLVPDAIRARQWQRVGRGRS